MSSFVVTAVRDQKVEAFGPLMCGRSKAEAIRGFFDACADANTLLAKHPQDFSLYYLGSYEDTTGVFEPANPMQLLAQGEKQVR